MVVPSGAAIVVVPSVPIVNDESSLPAMTVTPPAVFVIFAPSSKVTAEVPSKVNTALCPSPLSKLAVPESSNARVTPSLPAYTNPLSSAVTV